MRQGPSGRAVIRHQNRPLADYSSGVGYERYGLLWRPQGAAMYVLVPLLAPLALLGMMGLAWVEDHLLPPVTPIEPVSDPPGHPAV
jgi:hypothetical protein